MSRRSGEEPEPTAGATAPAPVAARLRRLLADRRVLEVPGYRVERRAAVVLALRPGGSGIEGSLPEEAPVLPSDGGAAPERGGGGDAGSRAGRSRFARRPPLEPAFAGLEALFVLRSERDGDPWSGQAGLPGGHREPGDEDLRAAARRELREETALDLEPEEILGRLDEVHPRSRRLPSVAVTPYVAWVEGSPTVRHGPEIQGHLWVPLSELEAPDRRTILTFRRDAALRVFPAVEVEGLTIWGLTFAIVRRFLEALPRRRSGGASP